MKITQNIARLIDGGVRDRGSAYFHNGQVDLLKGSPYFVHALVQGSAGEYDVQLKVVNKTLYVACECPYFADHGACKHVWATLMAADEHDYLRNALHVSKIDDSGTMYEDDEDDLSDRPAGVIDDDDDDGAALRRPPMLAPRPAPIAPRPAPILPRPAPLPGKRAAPPAWLQELKQVQTDDAQAESTRTPLHWHAGRELLYSIDVPASKSSGRLELEVLQRERKRDGDWAAPKPANIKRNQVSQLTEPIDQQIVTTLIGAAQDRAIMTNPLHHYHQNDDTSGRFKLTPTEREHLLPILCSTGRCMLRTSSDQYRARMNPDDAPALEGPVTWDDGPPWKMALQVVISANETEYLLKGLLRREVQTLEFEAVQLALSDFLFIDNRVTRVANRVSLGWLHLFQRRGSFAVPRNQGPQLIEEMLKTGELPHLELPDELKFESVSLPCVPSVVIKAEKKQFASAQTKLVGELFFDYGGMLVRERDRNQAVFDTTSRRLVMRDLNTEREAEAMMHTVGFKQVQNWNGPETWELAARNLPAAVKRFVTSGWKVEAEGKLFRNPGKIDMRVKSNIDWFELHGVIEYGDTKVQLPELLAAIKRGEDRILLGDGSFGLLPEAWLKKYGIIAGLGEADGDHLNFQKSQVGLLDALLSSQSEANVDEVFCEARRKVREFAGVQALDAPKLFVGELRPYQREGLGWLKFLQDFGFGGCLADDMGLGKTVQVLALLAGRRAPPEAKKANGKKTRKTKAEADEVVELPPPSLVVVPKSLVFNWIQEAAKFAPQLRILDHTGGERRKDEVEHFNEFDVILTTYGTLRRDAAQFRDFRFDYCILDEAQNIKNANTESAKAARLIQADHRLAMSGTPIENHLGELWSLFEFLNPGMLGKATVFQAGGIGIKNPSRDTRELLAKALRPFLLRRTKDQVASDLPQKLEQTLYCELEPEQRNLYNELRDHYRDKLLKRIESEGIGKAKIEVLEALLRLRQAAIHPGLLDEKRKGESSAKLDLLLPQLLEVLGEGHKALVFSQFTSMLAIVREKLDAEGIPYEYLDGQTRDRAARVEKFQTDPNCKLFLISLKAGGLGLNLTAAEYVFLLDPWWNPAVEAQAIDRAHRIGQTEKVFAYRLIARDTVEEKVLALQESKRDLADAIINADNSLVREMGADDLALLLS